MHMDILVDIILVDTLYRIHKRSRGNLRPSNCNREHNNHHRRTTATTIRSMAHGVDRSSTFASWLTRYKPRLPTHLR